jgi:hypothetical protein
MKNLILFIGFLLVLGKQIAYSQSGSIKTSQDTIICLDNNEFQVVRKAFNSFDYYKEAYQIHYQRINLLEQENKILYSVLKNDSLKTDLEASKNQDLLLVVSEHQKEKDSVSNSLKIALKELDKQKSRKKFWRITTFVVSAGLLVETSILILTLK